MAEALISETTIDTHEMVVIHRAFRRESRLLGELIAAVSDGDTERAAVLGRHLAWYQSGLTNHHHGEDELLWPVLRQRADVDAEIVVRMERQHGRVADTLAVVLGALRVWQESAAANDRDELLSTLSVHRRVLIEHLDDEEMHLLPLAGRHLTGPEWAALGEHFVATTPKAELLGAMPLLARLAWWSVGRRRYAAHIRKVRGNPAQQNRPLAAKNPTEV